ncbi:uncharacterized protein AMSG_04992 [Thecamonas trahens ATCC 50062]|uniref:Uncharacterized protein n=1 Tax=Thecamonas trahens ATCC 50062 TaxID=461836 RepID=A0A0L0D848_THETB|nr:hypothetical protein AMSG_04992 [Thecamonas trahens ATCC 50062]KNC48547.1 hypothetical protein AMSG_04992 [Thecamonas trahens ATCC 50062]|eukprot:XP_013758654.1 hypothetical protein AMSG_04992 [Thecamonas trahens ATCC 50062]
MDHVSVLSRELYRVVGEGDLEATKSLLADGADAEWRCEWDDGKNCLQLAALAGASHILRTLLETQAVDVHARDGSGRTALHLAVAGGSAEAAELLLDAGAEVDAKVWDMYETPLLLGVKEGAQEAVQTLLERGADVNCVEKTLGICNMTPLHWAAKLGLDHSATLLLYYGANVEAANDYKETPLHLAAAEGQVSAAGILVRAKADVNVRNVDGKTPLHLAVENGEVESAELLLTSGAHVDARDKNGETPLHAAVHHNQLPAVLLLLEHGAALDEQDSRGWTPLHTAAWTGKPRNVKVLLDKGADVNQVDRKGATALHYAAQYARGECVDILIAAGASLAQQDADGHTPIDHAFDKGHVQLVNLLTQRMKARDMTDAYVVDLLKQRQRVRDRNVALASKLIKRAGGPHASDGNGLHSSGAPKPRPPAGARPSSASALASGARGARSLRRPKSAADDSGRRGRPRGRLGSTRSRVPTSRFEAPELPPLSSTQVGSLSSSLLRPPRRSPYYAPKTAATLEARRLEAEAKVQSEMRRWNRAQAAAQASAVEAQVPASLPATGRAGDESLATLEAEAEIERLKLELAETKRRKVLKYEKRQLEMSRELRRLKRELQEREDAAKAVGVSVANSDTLSMDSSSFSQMSKKELRERNKLRRKLSQLRTAHASALQERNEKSEENKKLTKQMKDLRKRLRVQQDILRSKNAALKDKEGQLRSKHSELQSARTSAPHAAASHSVVTVDTFLPTWLTARRFRMKNPRQASYRPEESYSKLSTIVGLRRRKRMMPTHLNATERRQEELAHVREDMTDMLYFMVHHVDDFARAEAFQRMQDETAAKQAEYDEALVAKQEQEARIEELLAELAAEEAELEGQRHKLIEGMTHEFLAFAEDADTKAEPLTDPDPKRSNKLSKGALYRRKKRRKPQSSSVCAVM